MIQNYLYTSYESYEFHDYDSDDDPFSNKANEPSSLLDNEIYNSVKLDGIHHHNSG